MTMRDSKAVFDVKFHLELDIGWINDSERRFAINELFEECQNEQQVYVLDQLLRRFEFLDARRTSRCLRHLVEAISSTNGFSENSTQIVASTMDRGADSAQWILQAIKPEFKRVGLSAIKMLNTPKYSPKYFETRRNIFIIDEFMGTGKTMLSRFRWLKNACSHWASTNDQPNDFRICVVVVAAMEQAKRLLNRNNCDVICAVELKKGITGYEHGQKRRDSCLQMLQLEEKLALEIDGAKRPSFGWGWAQGQRILSLLCGKDL